jgi:hypothetical protein
MMTAFLPDGIIVLGVLSLLTAVYAARHTTIGRIARAVLGSLFRVLLPVLLIGGGGVFVDAVQMDFHFGKPPPVFLTPFAVAAGLAVGLIVQWVRWLNGRKKVAANGA